MTSYEVPAYWQYLGERPNTPFVPLRWQAQADEIIKVPWPGVKHDVPYPTIFGINCGRRTGKTTFAEKQLWKGLLAPDDMFGPPSVRVTADTEEHGHKIWDRFIFHLHNTDLKGLLLDYSKERELVTLISGATAQLISANNPNALSGDGVTLWLVDEAQFLTQPAWDNLFPSTAERDGIILMFGVSEGSGPFREACFRGEDKGYPEYKRLWYPTWENPYVPKWRIEFARRTLTPTKFRQLYEAAWVGELGKIFRNIEGCIRRDAILESPKGYFYTHPRRPGHDYFGGLDLGRLQDWTVYTIWDRAGRLIAWDRFSVIGWEIQKARIAEMSKDYGYPLTVVDSTGIGDPVFDDLTRKAMKVEEFSITTNTKKRTLVDELAIRIGASEISFPPIPVLLEELSKFEATKSKSEASNLVIYSAPAGANDDFVLSCALAQRVVPRISFMREPQEDFDTTYYRQEAPWERL